MSEINKKQIRTLEEIKEIAKEPEYDEIDKFVKITKTKRGCIVRIPDEITKYHKIKGGDRIRFYTKLKDGEDKLIIEKID